MSLEQVISTEVKRLNSTLCCTQNAERLSKAGKQRPTPRQLELLQYWSSFMLENDQPPTFREATKALGLQSPGPVYCRLKILLNKRLMTSDGSHYYPVTGSPEEWKLRNSLSQALKLYRVLCAHEPADITPKADDSPSKTSATSIPKNRIPETTSV